MSFLMAVPEEVGAAATSLTDIGSALNDARAAAALPTAGVVAAAEDQVSAAVAAVLSEHGAGYQAFGAQVAAFHDQFVQALTASAGAYARAEAANVSPLQQLLATDQCAHPSGYRSPADRQRRQRRAGHRAERRGRRLAAR